MEAAIHLLWCHNIGSGLGDTVTQRFLRKRRSICSCAMLLHRF